MCVKSKIKKEDSSMSNPNCRRQAFVTDRGLAKHQISKRHGGCLSEEEIARIEALVYIQSGRGDGENILRYHQMLTHVCWSGGGNLDFQRVRLRVLSDPLDWVVAEDPSHPLAGILRDLKEERREKTRVVAESVCVCSKCGSNRITITETHNRSADEGGRSTNECNDCGHMWIDED